MGGQPAGQGRPSISDLMTAAYQTDQLPGKILEAIQTRSGIQEITIADRPADQGQIRYTGNLYVPDGDELCLRIIQDDHQTALAGHPSRAKTFDLLDWGSYWTDMRKDVHRYVQNCHDCQRSQSSRHSTFGVLRPVFVPNKPWEDTLIDFVVGLPEGKEFDAIWVVVDPLSKMRLFIPCHSSIDALGLTEVVHCHGLPLTIVSDRGPQFASLFWQQVCSQLGIDQRMSTACHPQADRQTE